MATIMSADVLGLPVSTTHVLSSGIAGTMVANQSGIQARTVRNIAAAWVLTLPVSMMLAGGIFLTTEALAGSPHPPAHAARSAKRMVEGNAFRMAGAPARPGQKPLTLPRFGISPDANLRS